MTNNLNVQYDRHQDEWQEIISSPEGKELGASWMRDDTLDYWRHERLRKFVIPIIRFESDACWLTVGDGRYGSDGHYLKSCGAKRVHCSDYSDALLEIGKELGYIKEFSAQNAEALSFGDEEFDYVFCKDALHHFPRPYIALNEMFRVSRRGVILIEPRDRVIDRPLLHSLNLPTFLFPNYINLFNHWSSITPSRT
jgi:ubiquinone/menaquinone biosynthesis C-methylase UbiE